MLLRIISIPRMEFLVAIEVRFPDHLGPEARAELETAEAVRGTVLARAGIIGAIWRVPGRLSNCGIWSAADATALHEALVSLPLWPFMTIEVTPLARHPLAQHCQGLLARTLTPEAKNPGAGQ
jgi:muconolactone D-isomerase